MNNPAFPSFAHCLRTRCYRSIVLALGCCCLLVFASGVLFAQATTFAGNAQHTSSYPAPAQNLNTFKWIASVDLNNTGGLIHYGAPLVTAANTVLVPVKTGATGGFQVSAFNGANGAAKYTLATDYILPAHNWIPAYNPTIATGSFGTRLYYAGAGGTILHVNNPDSNTPGVPVREVFYTSLSNYNANATAFNNSIFVNTPITADSQGNIYFGFRVQGTAPAPLNTMQSGFARIDPNGIGTFVLAGTAAADPMIERDSHNVAPALSNDESTLYVVVKWATNARYCYLLGLNPTTLTTKYRAFLKDPRSDGSAAVPEDGTASPMVAPDGDVYFGVQGTPADNGSRGFLLRFSGDLSTTKTPGGFGWDYTAGIVPASSVPSYTGSSSYLLFCKYNDYAFQDGSGVNRVALLDPNATQIDPHSSSPGLIEMREVLTVIGPTPDAEHQTESVYAVREWCINAPAINPATKSIYFNNEDGRAYRWNLATNSLDQAITLNTGIGQPYVPTVIGPDGTVYTLNGGTIYAIGANAEVNVAIASSSPDLRTTVVGSPITFTATVTGTIPPTGTVTFFDNTYNGLTPESVTLASNVPLNASGQATVTTSSLAAGGSYLGNHFIVAIYNGDGNHASTFATMMQKVHAKATTTTLKATPNPSGPGQIVSLEATVDGITNAGETPTGMVTFSDGATAIGQLSIDANGGATIETAALSDGSHVITATYVSDTVFAASSASTTLVVNPPIVQLSSATYTTTEGANTLSVQVTRAINNTAVAVSVDYATADSAGANNCNVVGGVASSRCDYLTTLGTLHFAAGEVSKTISIPIVDDAYAEGDETFFINLSNVKGGFLGTSGAMITLHDNETVNGANPIDQAGFFVRQHYIDFLNREPDADGLAFWTNQITQCGADAACIELKRINVSAAFFLAIEFQETGYLAYRTYKASFGNLATPPGAPVPVKFTDFLRDAQEIARGVQVGIGEWQTQLEANKQAYELAFVSRSDFLAAFPNSLTADQFVTQLDTNAGGVLSTSEKASLVALLGATPADLTKRASVMRSVAEDADLKNAEKNKAFVLMQYFGYLRRNPYDPPEHTLDYAGYNFWLGKLNEFNGNFVNADMVKAFIISSEYRQRFGP
ncbi:MAG TPA: Ig-like domain repeat protein [Pyrinomonadaceae bacterium]|nr:Ig-like domain repeat protein [Pyrinomonadaceae bacterium]